MFTRFLSRWPAGGGALLLVLALSGVAAAATVVVATAPPTGHALTPSVPDTTLAFVDTNGNGINDRCEQNVVADPAAAAAAEAAVDLNHDGKVSASEAAQSNRTGRKNCNHGGYVSSVAHDQVAVCQATTTTGGAGAAITNNVTAPDGTECASSDATDSSATDTTNSTDTSNEAPKAPCQVVAGPQPPAQPDTAPNAHGKWVSSVAQSDAIGGKNCNHGGAVSEAAKLGKAERDAAKAARKAERQAAKAARKSQGQ